MSIYAARGILNKTMAINKGGYSFGRESRITPSFKSMGMGFMEEFIPHVVDATVSALIRIEPSTWIKIGRVVSSFFSPSLSKESKEGSATQVARDFACKLADLPSEELQSQSVEDQIKDMLELYEYEKHIHEEGERIQLESDIKNIIETHPKEKAVILIQQALDAWVASGTASTPSNSSIGEDRAGNL